MRLADSLLPEFDQEMAGTRRVLERVPEDRLEWRPHPKSWPLSSLATHVLMIPHWGLITLTHDFYDMNPTGGAPETAKPIDNVGEALDRFDRNVREARAALLASSDEQLRAEWRLLMGGQVLKSLPRLEVWRSMLMNHLIHHRGQLTVYLRLLDQPLPAIYGPSADEKI